MAQRAALDRTTATRRKLPFRATSRTLEAAVVVGVVVVTIHLTIPRIIRRIRPVTRRRSPRVTAAAEVEDSPTFPASKVNSLASSVVLGSEKERVLKMHLLNRAPMPPLMHPLCRHTATDRIGLYRRSPSQSNLRPTRLPTHNPTHRSTLSCLEKAINLLTTNLCDSSGIAAGPEDTVTLGEVLGITRLQSQNRKKMKRARIRGRKISNLDTLRTATLLELRRSLTLSKGLDSEPCTRFHDRREGDDLMGLDRGQGKRIDRYVLVETCVW